MSKPVHPATVHFPIAFIMLGYGLDIYDALTPQLPAAVTARFPLSAADTTRASYYLVLLGLLTFVPAVASGVGQAVQMIGKQGLYEADGKTLREKVKATIAHALLMDVVLAASAYLWNQRRVRATSTLAGKLSVGSLATAEAAYAPLGWEVAAGAALLAAMGLSANIGGALTYNYGVGFKAIGASGKKKQ